MEFKVIIPDSVMDQAMRATLMYDIGDGGYAEVLQHLVVSAMSHNQVEVPYDQVQVVEV